MLEIVKYNQDEYEFPALIVLGCFESVHIGHAELLKKAKLQAKINGLDLGVMLFVGGKGGKQVFTLEERLSILEQYNVKFVVEVEFTDEFKKTKPLDFLACLEDKINVKAYMSGKDFRFGEGAKGKSSTLKNYGEDEENGVWYMSVKDVLYGNEKISTTLVKTMLANGNIKTANELLGKNYFITGTVSEGADRGEKTLGFPTANVAYPAEKADLKRGVYAVKCTVGETVYDGIANFGARPTFDESDDVLEAYLIGYEGSLYGENIKVEFTEYLRDIQKFDSADALREQLLKDLQKAKELAEAEAQAKALAEEAKLAAAAATAEKPVEAVPQTQTPATVQKPVEAVAPQAQTPAAATELPVEELAITAEPVTETIEEPVAEEPAAAEEQTEASLEETVEEEALADEITDYEAEYLKEQVDETENSEEQTTETESVTEEAEQVTEAEDNVEEKVDEAEDVEVDEPQVEESLYEVSEDAEAPLTETPVEEEDSEDDEEPTYEQVAQYEEQYVEDSFDEYTEDKFEDELEEEYIEEQTEDGDK